MARIWSGAISKALIVENPARELDELLRTAGVEVHRLENTPDEDGLIAAVNALGVQAIFKRSKVGVSRRVIESCPSLLVVQLCCIGDDSVDKDACAEHGWKSKFANPLATRQFIKLFDEINYVKAEEDYDKFCLINKVH